MKATYTYPILLLLFSLLTMGNTKSETAKRKISIKLEHVLGLSNNGVGQDWNHFLSINKNVIKKDEELIVELKKRAPLRIEAHSIEEDKNYSDAGDNHMDFTYSDLISIQESSRFEMNVIVMENGGPNAGNIAKWKFIFEMTKIE
jgi:hypothetical protein